MSKILKHLDKEEIIKRLSGGESIRKTAAWLKDKYPDNKKLHISTVSLQNFRKHNLELEGRVLKDIQEANMAKKLQQQEEGRQKQLETTNAYQDKINSIVDTHLNVANKILRLDHIIEDRMEYWYNAISTGEATPSQADKEMRQYMDRQMMLLQQYKKFIEGMADHTVDYNVNVTVMNDQVSLIRDIIREVLEEFDANTAILFMDKLSKRLNQATYSPDIVEPVNVKQLDNMQVKLLDNGDF